MTNEEIREEWRLKREKLAQGWTMEEINMGKGWKENYPNIAKWQGGRRTLGSDGGAWEIALTVYSNFTFGSFQSIEYTLVEKHIAHSTKQDIYRNIDEAIKEWNDEHGEETILAFRKGWWGQDNWEFLYSHIAGWIKQGKRHCIDIRINFVTHKSSAKVWYYDKSSETETILFEKEMEGLTESEILVTIDEGIQNWMKQEGRETLSYPS